MAGLRIIPGSAEMVRFMAARFSPDQVATLHAVGAEALLQNLEADVQNSARSWCAVDDNGPVFLVGVIAQPDGSGAYVWYLTTTAVERHPRACIRLWRRAAGEALAEFGAIRADMPPYVTTVRRMQRYGFHVAAPAPDSAGTVMCRCDLVARPAYCAPVALPA